MYMHARSVVVISRSARVWRDWLVRRGAVGQAQERGWQCRQLALSAPVGQPATPLRMAGRAG
jgi:hypothetical protein